MIFDTRQDPSTAAPLHLRKIRMLPNRPRHLHAILKILTRGFARVLNRLAAEAPYCAYMRYVEVKHKRYASPEIASEKTWALLAQIKFNFHHFKRPLEHSDTPHKRLGIHPSTPYISCFIRDVHDLLRKVNSLSYLSATSFWDDRTVQKKQNVSFRVCFFEWQVYKCWYLQATYVLRRCVSMCI